MRGWSQLVVIAVVAVATGSMFGCEQQGLEDHGSPLGRLAVEDWKIEPGTRVGGLRRYGSTLDLAKAYGASNLRDSSISIGEGDTEMGTLLYGEDPQRRLEILWSDGATRQGLKRVILRGERSRWMLPGGISLGTSLTELESKNGRPFRLSGFGWDYAGAVISWNGGQLEGQLPATVKIYVEPRIEDRVGRAYGRVQGDHEFLSSHPAMQTLNPRVYQIFADF
jgi:hypothetical protein